MSKINSQNDDPSFIKILSKTGEITLLHEF